MFSLLRCSRAPPRTSLFRSFIHNSARHAPSNTSCIISQALYTNANVKRRLFHTTPLRRHAAFKPTLIKQETAGRSDSGVIEEGQPTFDEPVAEPPGIARQIFFFAVGSAALYFIAAASTTGATIFSMEQLRGSIYSISNVNIMRVWDERVKKTSREAFQACLRKMFFLTQSMKDSLDASYRSYLEMSSAKRLMWTIVMINGSVFLLWKYPFRAVRGFMHRNFTHSALSGKSFTLLTSTFSHEAIWHIGFNMFALYGFGAAAYNYLAEAQARFKPQIFEATANFHFLAFFATAGMFASLFSHIVTAKLRIPAAMRFFQASTIKPVAARTLRMIFPPSLGASGAIYACVTLTALAFPNSAITILFIPIPINIQTGVMGLIALDIMGILRGWRSFDHVAHLGGALFGAFYYYYGPSIWYRFRDLFGIKDRASTGGRLLPLQ